ncbi:hypothetical protein [Chroococcidiopsis sp.]|uniref:hypothetical protein n=1 Tax=Chroococcidiopsis sp. TaxID=3088168 RepID=UPI003F2C4093
MSIEIKGAVEVRIVDAKSGEIKQIIEQDNLIPNNTFKLVLGEESQNLILKSLGAGVGAVIGIFANLNPTSGTYQIGTPLGVGYVPTGLTSPTWYEEANPPYGELYNRIDYTGFARSFQGIGLIREEGTYTNAKAIAYLSLATTCIQGAYDYIDVYYRIQFPSATGITKTGLLDFGGRFFDTRYWQFFYLSTYFGKKPQQEYTNLWFHSDNAVITTTPARGASNTEIRWDTVTINNDNYNTRFNKEWKETAHVGTIFNLMMHGKSSTLGVSTDLQSVYTHTDEILDIVGNVPSVFQAMFGHRSTATTPFFDSLALPLGNGKVRLAGNWTGKFPELYRIDIVTGGDIGVATYKWSVRKHLGFEGNTYTDRIVKCVYRNPKIAAAPKMHGWRETDNDVHRYSNTQIVQYDETGVTLLDVVDGAYQNWEATTTPVLACTQARQVAVDSNNQKIYVGCRQTGLWVIDIAANSVTRPITYPCYGVDVGRGGVAYALVEGGLYASTDWSNAFAFTYAGVTDGNWSNVYYLKADPEHVEDRLALVIAVPSANNKIVWLRVNPQPITFTYSSNGDNNGICYYRGTYNNQETAWTNPHTAATVTVIASATNSGSVTNLTSRTTDSHNTTNAAAAWIAIDLGEDVLFTPNSYTLQNHNVASSAIRNWKLQGSNNVGANTPAGIIAATWVDLDTRVNDASMANIASVWGSYSITPPSVGYRWMRILQTGLNASSTNILAISEFEFYGTLNFQKATSGIQDIHVKPWTAAVDVSDVGSFWATTYTSGTNMFARKLYFGLARNKDSTQTNTIVSQTINHPTWGSVFLFKIAFYKNYLITSTALLDFFLAVVNNYTAIGARTFLIHLDSGIVLNSQGLRQLFTDNTYCWSAYGWNGNAWELGHSGVEFTHLDNKNLASGVNVRFESSNNAPIFNTTDFYTQSINYGFLKDNASYLNWSSTQFTKPTHFRDKYEITIPENGSLYVPLPYMDGTNTFELISTFAFVYISDSSLYDVFIDGEPAVRILSFNGAPYVQTGLTSTGQPVYNVNPLAPVPTNYRECVIFSTGFVLFGPGCVQVPIAIYYTWIEA